MYCSTVYPLHAQEPISVKLGEQRVRKGTGPRRHVLEEDTFMYVPVLKTLKTLLQNDLIIAEVCTHVVFHEWSAILVGTPATCE